MRLLPILLLTFILLSVLSLRIKKGRSCEVTINGVDIGTKVQGKIVDFLGAEQDGQKIIVRVLVKNKGSKAKQETVTLKGGKDGFEQEIECGGFVMAQQGGEDEGAEGAQTDGGQEQKQGSAGKESPGGNQEKEAKTGKNNVSNKNVDYGESEE